MHLPLLPSEVNLVGQSNTVLFRLDLIITEVPFINNKNKIIKHLLIFLKSQTFMPVKIRSFTVVTPIVCHSFTGKTFHGVMI